MIKKLVLILVFCIGGLIYAVGEENPIVFIDFSRELSVDSFKPVLEGKGYSWYENKPSVSDSKLYGDYKVECYGATDQCEISILYTPKTRKIYDFIIKREIPKNHFLKEAIQFYKLIKDKYGSPISGNLLNGDYFLADTDEEHKEKINTKEVILDSLYLKSCFGSSQPVEYCWVVKNTSIVFSIHQLSNYNPHMTCRINNRKVTESYFEELSLVNDEIEHKNNVETLKNVVIYTLLASFFLLLLYSYVKTSIKQKKEQKVKDIEIQQRIKKEQRKVDANHTEYKKQLVEKYGAITRAISNICYDNNSVRHYEDIFVFEKPKKIIFDNTEYDFADILSCSMYDENHKDIPPTQVTRTSTGSLLGRAAVGGLTLGVAGAVVGAMTAKTESRSNLDSSFYIGSYIVKIGLKSIEKPTMTLKYGNNKSKAEEVYALMQAIIAMK